jgi:hypothetical protein
MSNNSEGRESSNYFKEYANGLGYLNEVKPIPNSGTPPRYSAKISALQGLSGNIHYEYHDLTIDSAQAMGLLFHYKDEIADDNKKVIVKFHYFNPRARGFILKEGERKGEIGTTINGYLTRISYMSIDGEVVFSESENDNAGDDGNAKPTAEDGQAKNGKPASRSSRTKTAA